jgi:hypothetical protein
MIWKILGAAGFIRLLLSRFSGFPDALENRVELANTQVGIKAVREAIFLLDEGVPIYQTKSVCQPSPLLVNLVGAFEYAQLTDVLFICLDLIAGLLIYRIVQLLSHRSNKDYQPTWSAAMY